VYRCEFDKDTVAKVRFHNRGHARSWCILLYTFDLMMEL